MTTEQEDPPAKPKKAAGATADASTDAPGSAATTEEDNDVFDIADAPGGQYVSIGGGKVRRVKD